MYVAPDTRGLRVGRLLLRGVEELAASRGYQLLRLETGTQQPEALRLYDSSGWSRIECYGYFKDDPTTICYEKTDRKSTRLNSSHANISYAVFCLKKKTQKY